MQATPGEYSPRTTPMQMQQGWRNGGINPLEPMCVKAWAGLQGLTLTLAQLDIIEKALVGVLSEHHCEHGCLPESVIVKHACF